MPSKGIFPELKRRNVFKVAVAYLVLSWLLIQVADVLFPSLRLPEWSVTLVVGMLAIGFVPALIFSWVYELTPEGLKRESDVPPDQSITTVTGRRLNLLTILLLLAVTSVILIEHLQKDESSEQYRPASKANLPPNPDTGEETENVPILAVLPFKISGSDDGGLLANGLHDELLTRLARTGAFRVISRTSVMEYGDTSKNIRRIGEELGASHIIEGSVQALAQRVRVNAQLIDAITDQHLWADSYDREMTAENLFEIQAGLSVVIANELRVKVNETAREVIVDVPTYNTGAYQAYLRGQQLANSGDYSFSTLRESAEAYEEAVNRDPDFALAWAALARARTYLARPLLMDELNEAMLDKALEALNKARSLQPGLLEADLAWVDYLAYGLGEYQQALGAIEALGDRARFDADALILHAGVYAALNRFHDAYPILLEANVLDPRSVSITYRLIMFSLFTGNCDAAQQHLERAQELAPMHRDIVYAAADFHIACSGDLAAAVDLYRDYDFVQDTELHNARAIAVAARDYGRLLELTDIPLPEDRALNPVFDQIDRYIALNRLGRQTEAQALLEALGVSLSGVDETVQAENPFWYARAQAWYSAFIGDQRQTLYWTDRERQHWYTVSEDASVSAMYHWQARILALAGLEHEAIATLDLLLEEGSWYVLPDLFIAPEFDRLKDNPEFHQLKIKHGSR